MTGKQKYMELARLFGSGETARIAAFLEHENIGFKIVNNSQGKDHLCRQNSKSTIIQVLEEDFRQAEQLISDYRRVQGVPFS
jgi:hypothetical protein